MTATRHVLLGVVLIGGMSAPAFAQAGAPAPPAFTVKRTIATSPLLDAIGYINAEYQRKVAGGLVVGVSAGTLLRDYDGAVSSGMAVTRYYLRKSAFSGFFVGGTAGVKRLRYDTDMGDAFTTRGAIGGDVGYDWLLGAKKNIYIGVSSGGMHIFGPEVGNVGMAYPTTRANIGFAF